MYKIQKVNPIPSNSAKSKGIKSKFPFEDLAVGEGFFVPNKDKMPPAELASSAHTLANMQAHCADRNKRPKFNGAVFRAHLHPEDDCWIQVWRES